MVLMATCPERPSNPHSASVRLQIKTGPTPGSQRLPGHGATEESHTPARVEGQWPGGWAWAPGQYAPHPQASRTPSRVKIRDLRPRPQSFLRTLSPSDSPSHSHKTLEASPIPWLPPVPASPGTPGHARPHLTEHPTPGGQGQGPGGLGKREEGLPRPFRRPARKRARRGRQKEAPNAHGGSRALPAAPGKAFSHRSGRCSRLLWSHPWGPRKPCAQDAGGMRPPRNGWGRSRSQTPVLTSASCWCVPRRRRLLAGPGRRAPLRARSPAAPQPLRASRSVRAGNSSGGS